jgi:formate dehydrogenase subunit gamma
MATTPPSARLRRWSRTERAVHWVHATAFVILLGSGLCLYLPSLAEVVSRRPLLKHIHIYTAAAWAVALVLVFVFGDRRALLRTAREVDDLRTDSRLNKTQKLNAIVVAAFAILFAVSGFDLWYGERDTRFRFANTLLIHDWLMYLSLFIFLGHLYYALILPSTRHALSGMTRGWVDRDWAERQHPEWVNELETES